jgi:Transposase DDE domain group 1
VVRFYNKRGTAEQWIKEGKLAVNWTRLSCHRFRGNEVRLWLSVIAYNLGNLWRRLALPKKIGNWSLTSLQQRLVALLLAAFGRTASHAAAFWQHAAKDRGAAAAERVAKQERQRIERSEVIQWGEVLVGRQVGSEKQTRPVRNCPTSRTFHLTVATVIRA